MKARYLYISGEYVHTKAELLKRIQKLINNEHDKDATIKLLSDLYRNGHLRSFCDDITFELEPWRGDTQIANHIISKLSGDLETPVFDLAFHKRVTFDSIEIRRDGEMTIKIIKSQKNNNESEFTYLMNGFRKHTDKHKIATVEINYTVLKPINEKIPIYIGASKAELILSIPGNKSIEVTIPESLLDPAKDISILIGARGQYGKICLKAPQINIPITFNKEKVSYPMMRIIKWSSHITTVEVYYIGLWPFEYNNKNDVKTYGILLLPGWGKLLETDNYLLQNWFLNAKINFLLYPNEPKSAESVNEKWNYLKARFLDFVLKPIQKNDNRLDIPSCKDWEYAAFMDPYATEHVKDIKDFKGNAVICAEGNQPIELSSENLKRRIRPNSHGLYAMIGNVYELAEDYWQPNFMGGDISNQYNCKRLFENELEKVPFWGIRLAIRDYKE